jgi:hypothetical protein
MNPSKRVPITPVADDSLRDAELILAAQFRATWRSGKARPETNHAACQDEKARYLAAYPSGRNQRSRSPARRSPDLTLELAAAHDIRPRSGLVKF